MAKYLLFAVNWFSSWGELVIYADDIFYHRQLHAGYMVDSTGQGQTDYSSQRSYKSGPADVL
jgi:hypothetical protein